MHPELLRAIAKDRHQGLLYDPRFPGQTRAPRQTRPLRVPLVRKHVGALLIRVGARLVGDRPVELELAMSNSTPRTAK